MSRCAKILEKAKQSPANLRFEEACYLAECYGFILARQKGTSHRVYKRPGFFGLMNFQNINGMAKEYQVTQLLEAIEEIDEENGHEQV